MRWATYLSPRDGGERAGLVMEQAIHGLKPGIALLDLLGDDGEALRKAARHASADPAEVVPLVTAKLRPPIPRPPSIRDSGSFEAHMRSGYDARKEPFPEVWYRIPMMYFSNPYGVVGTREDVVAAAGSQMLDFELEVAAVVGRAGRDLEPEEAEAHIAGYCVYNDWSARDLQAEERVMPGGVFKSKDWAQSLGPWLVTKEELEPYRKGRAFDLQMTAAINGRQVSRGNLADIYWSFAELVAFASRGTWVMPGDVIGSGAVGTGSVKDLKVLHGPQGCDWLRPGDEVALEVERLGSLVNRICPAREARPLRPARE